MPVNLSQRSYQAELMDDLSFGGDDMIRTLDELEIINLRLGGHKVVLNALNRLLKNAPAHREIHIADLGCGGGDMLRILAKWGRKKGLKLKLHGIDANKFIAEYGEFRSAEYPEISYHVADIFSDKFAMQGYDIILCSLFCHHFDETHLQKLFRQLKKQARLCVVINDLHRHWFAYYSIKYITKVFSKSPLIKNDAPLSVARGFSRKDIEKLMYNSLISDYDLKWKWAWRWQLVF
jgi:ubiquinone/menaquinone biosynthesis C-methylase UbiE